MPLELFCLQEALKTYTRLKPVLEFGWSGKTANKTYSTSHLKFWNDHLSNIPSVGLEMDNTQETLWETVFSCDLDSFKETNTVDHTELNLYTDGSKINNNIGAGCCLIKNNIIIWEKSFRLPDTASVFQAEIFAVLKGAQPVSGRQLITMPISTGRSAEASLNGSSGVGREELMM